MNYKASKDAPQPALQTFSVGEWQVFPDRHELVCGATRVRVQPRLIALLRRLAVAAGQTVARETLLDEVWTRRMVNDEVLSRAIADLRLALGDDARQPRYLVTVPKLGYRLIAPVSFALPALMGATDASTVDAIAPALGSHAGWRWPHYTAGVLLLLVFAALWAWRAPARYGVDAARLALAQPLTSDPGWEQEPRVSASGEQIAWVVRERPEAHSVMRVRSRDGQQLRDLGGGDHDDRCPLFAPDEASVYFQRYTSGRCMLMRQSLKGDAATALTACAAAIHSCPSLTADGSSILLSAPPLDVQHAAGLQRWRLQDGSTTQLTNPTRAQGDDFDPLDMRGRIYFARGQSSEAELHELDGNTERRIPIDRSMVYGLTAHGDGRLLLASDLLGFRALIALDPASGEAELLGARGARYPQRNGRGDLVYELAHYDANLWLQQSGSTQGRRLTQSNRYDGYPRLAPDAHLLVYQSNRDGLEALYLLDLGNNQERKLSLSGAERWAHPAWSADGTTLLLTRYANAGTEIWRYGLANDLAQRMTALPLGAHDAQYDLDGRQIWYLLNDAGQTRLHRYSPDPGAATFVLPGSVFHYQIDPQGLFLLRSPDTSLQRCAWPMGDRCVDLQLRPAAAQERNWAVADGAVYWVADDASGTLRLQRLSLLDRQIETLPWAPPSTLSRALDVSRDGQTVVIARTDSLDIDLMWLQAP